MAAALVPYVRPRYVVRKERRVYLEHHTASGDRTMRADVAVLSSRQVPPEPVQRSAPASGLLPVMLHLPIPDEQHETFLTIAPATTIHSITSARSCRLFPLPMPVG